MAGYHLFSTGEVLTAANVNDYVMKQTVMVFASAAARTTALSGVLREGMVSYRTDSHITEYYNGSAWATLGSVLTTKGDLATFDTASQRLAVGADGTTLVANSSAATGLSYQPTPSASNPVLNSAMQVWQRGTTSADSAGNPYTADRWQLSRSTTSGATVSRQPTGDTTNLPNIQYCSRVQRTAANASTSVIYFSQSFESINSIPLAGKTVTLSFYARAGANFSSASNVLSGYLETGTGTDQNIVTVAWTGAANPITFNSTLTTTWQRFTYTGTLAATATQIGLLFNYTPVGTAGANDYFEITGVQIDVGSVALPFRTNGGTYQSELAACQRYYWRTTSTGVVGTGLASATSNCQGLIRLPVTMRISPTALDYSAPTLYDGNTTTTGTVSTLWAAGGTNDGTVNVGAAATLTALKPYFIAVGASGYYGFSAEI